MLTQIAIRNFKLFEDVTIELGAPVVFIGPNNSGKTSAIQALALWDTGLKHWNAKRSGKTTPRKRAGVAVNRRELFFVPVPEARLLWRERNVRDAYKLEGRPQTRNVRIEIAVEGVTGASAWQCGLEFDYANEESFYCRPLRLSEDGNPERMDVPDAAESVRIAYLPPMSGLAAVETRLDPGALNVRIGEGRTAEVLRNLCYMLHTEDRDLRWTELVEQMRSLFGVELQPPRYIPSRGEIEMSYMEQGTTLDLSSAGRGLQQTLLLLAYMYSHPETVLLLDEPDAHLEILRQRQIYGLLTDIARETASQIIIASHSEILLNEAAERDLVVAFVGQPHRLQGRTSQVHKSLSELGFEQYYQAQQTGWVLYLEGSTDLAILQAFARKLEHAAAVRALERPFVCYVSDQPRQVRRHFHGLREAVPHLQGVALFDRLGAEPPDIRPVKSLMWERREIENYFCTPSVLEAYAAQVPAEALGPLFEAPRVEKNIAAMQEAVRNIESALQALDKADPWGTDIKASDDFLGPVFKRYFEILGLANPMAKRSFYELVAYMPAGDMPSEISDKLEAIAAVAERADRSRDA